MVHCHEHLIGGKSSLSSFWLYNDILYNDGAPYCMFDRCAGYGTYLRRLAAGYGNNTAQFARGLWYRCEEYVRVLWQQLQLVYLFEETHDEPYRGEAFFVQGVWLLFPNMIKCEDPQWQDGCQPCDKSFTESDFLNVYIRMYNVEKFTESCALSLRLHEHTQ